MGQACGTALPRWLYCDVNRPVLQDRGSTLWGLLLVRTTTRRTLSGAGGASLRVHAACRRTGSQLGVAARHLEHSLMAQPVAVVLGCRQPCWAAPRHVQARPWRPLCECVGVSRRDLSSLE